jgi:hypothetical protein
MFWATKEAAVYSPASQIEVRSFRSYEYRIICVLDGARLRQNDEAGAKSPVLELTIRPISHLCGAASCQNRVVHRLSRESKGFHKIVLAPDRNVSIDPFSYSSSSCGGNV